MPTINELARLGKQALLAFVAPLLAEVTALKARVEELLAENAALRAQLSQHQRNSQRQAAPFSRASAHLSVSIKGLLYSGRHKQGKFEAFAMKWELLWKHRVCRSSRPSPRTGAGDQSLFRGFCPIP
jgi:hypothetical protein